MSDGSILSPFTDLRTALINPRLASGDTIYLRAGTHALTADTTLTASGITIKSYPGEHAVIDLASSDLTISGTSIVIENLEIMSSDGVRETENAGSHPEDITLGAIIVHGHLLTLIGCTIHDIQQFGWWSAAHGGLMRDCLLYNVGWIAPDRGHGHLLYSQHAGDTVRAVDNCIFGQSYAWGVHHYANSARLDNLTLSRIIHYTDLAVIGGEPQCPSVAGIILDECAFWDCSTDLGYTAVNLYDLTLTANYFGLRNRTVKSGWQSVTETGTVHKTTGDNDAFVYPCQTAPRVAHIAVFNWQQLAAVSVDVSALSLTVGASYRLRNALDPLADYDDFTYDGSGALSINMAARSVAVPIGYAVPLVAWDIRFGAFVLETV